MKKITIVLSEKAEANVTELLENIFDSDKSCNDGPLPASKEWEEFKWAWSNRQHMKTRFDETRDEVNAKLKELLTIVNRPNTSTNIIVNLQKIIPTIDQLSKYDVYQKDSGSIKFLEDMAKEQAAN